MAFIFGVATQEGDLYKILRDFLAGAATPGQYTYSGTGTGDLNNLRLNPKHDGAYEEYVLTCESVAPRGGTFGVVGSRSGVLPDATVGTVYKTPHVEFYIDFGDVDFALGDRFVITTLTGELNRPRFAHLMGGPEMGTDVVTLTCTREETINPPVPAMFSVQATSIGELPALTQGEWYRNQYLTLLLESASTESSRFLVGDEIKIPFTRNPLRQANQHWQILRKTLISDPQQFGVTVPDMDSELVMRGPGLSGDDSVYWGMTRHWNDSTAAAWWVHYGMGGYIPNMPMNEQALVQGGQTGVRPIHTFWSLNIPYTIIASGRCFKVLTRSNIYYSQSYQGLMLPTSMPKYYGYPYFSGGTGHTRSTMWSALSSARASFWNYLGNTQGSTSGESSAYVVKDDRTWGAINGSWIETVSNPVRPNFNSNVSYPYAHQGMYDLRANLDGTVPLLPIQLSPNLGQLDGVFAVPGRDGRQPEEILVNSDGSRALVVQNHHRSGFNDFCAFILE